MQLMSSLCVIISSRISVVGNVLLGVHLGELGGGDEDLALEGRDDGLDGSGELRLGHNCNNNNSNDNTSENNNNTNNNSKETNNNNNNIK